MILLKCLDLLGISSVIKEKLETIGNKWRASKAIIHSTTKSMLQIKVRFKIVFKHWRSIIKNLKVRQKRWKIKSKSSTRGLRQPMEPQIFKNTLIIFIQYVFMTEMPKVVTIIPLSMTVSRKNGESLTTLELLMRQRKTYLKSLKEVTHGKQLIGSSMFKIALQKTWNKTISTSIMSQKIHLLCKVLRSTFMVKEFPAKLTWLLRRKIRF